MQGLVELIVLMLYVMMSTATLYVTYAKCGYTDFHRAQCHHLKCHYDQCCFAECPYYWK